MIFGYDKWTPNIFFSHVFPDKIINHLCRLKKKKITSFYVLGALMGHGKLDGCLIFAVHRGNSRKPSFTSSCFDPAPHLKLAQYSTSTLYLAITDCFFTFHGTKFPPKIYIIFVFLSDDYIKKERAIHYKRGILPKKKKTKKKEEEGFRQ